MKDFKVWVTDIETLEDNSRFLAELGTLLNKENTAKNFNQKISDIIKGIKIQKSVLPDSEKSLYDNWFRYFYPSNSRQTWF